jgi:demethylmenaquinone methyltransferase/2-methoxy-6-polyprenyl-1,4-benzoquinol methylase
VSAVDTTYDRINRALFLPWGGSRRIRRQLVEALGVRSGQRVLELGCGTGLVTELLVDAGAEVVGVDAMEEMLVGARRRAPAATFVLGDALEAELGGGFDRVVLAFVLHNLDGRGRTRLLRRARAALAPGGRIGILEWAQPRGRLRGRWWRRFLARLEPSPAVAQILDGELEADIGGAGLRVERRRHPAAGRTQVLVLEPVEVGSPALQPAGTTPP